MARQPRSLESLLADVAVSGRGDRAELFSTPAMLAVTADMIEDEAITWDVLHPEIVTNLDENTQALADLDVKLADAESRLNADMQTVRDDLAGLDVAVTDTIQQAINENNAIPLTNERFSENSLSIWPFINGAVPHGALAPGSVGNNDIADFAIAVKKLKSDRHQLY